MADDKPSFKALFEQYIDAYNTQSLSEIEKLLSPKVEVNYRGTKISEEYGESMKKYYTDHWAMPDCKITIVAIEEKKDENAVDVKLGDHARSKLVSVKYTWAKEDGKWLHAPERLDNWKDLNRTMPDTLLITDINVVN